MFTLAHEGPAPEFQLQPNFVFLLPCMFLTFPCLCSCRFWIGWKLYLPNAIVIPLAPDGGPISPIPVKALDSRLVCGQAVTRITQPLWFTVAKGHQEQLQYLVL